MRPALLTRRYLCQCQKGAEGDVGAAVTGSSQLQAQPAGSLRCLQMLVMLEDGEDLVALETHNEIRNAQHSCSLEAAPLFAGWSQTRGRAVVGCDGNLPSQRQRFGIPSEYFWMKLSWDTTEKPTDLFFLESVQEGNPDTNHLHAPSGEEFCGRAVGQILF